MPKKSDQNRVLETIYKKIVSISSDIEELKLMRGEFQEFKTEIYNHIDGFVKLHMRLDTEFVALRYGHERLDGRVSRLENPMGHSRD